MTRTEQITHEVCDRFGIVTGLYRPYELEDVLMDNPEYKRLNTVYRRSGKAIRITAGAAGLFFLFWIVATFVTLAVQ